MLILSLPRDGEKIYAARDVFVTFSTHADLVYDTSCFREFLTSILDKQDDKSSEKRLCVYFYIQLLSTGVRPHSFWSR